MSFVKSIYRELLNVISERSLELVAYLFSTQRNRFSLINKAAPRLFNILDNFAKLYLDPQAEMSSSREMRDGMEVLFNLFFKWFLLLLKS